MNRDKPEIAKEISRIVQAVTTIIWSLAWLWFGVRRNDAPNKHRNNN